MADRSMDLRAVGPLCRVIREVRPDIVHTHGAMAGRAAARLCGRRTIYTKHCVFPLGPFMSSPLGRLTGRLTDACLSDGAIAISPSVRELLLQSGVPDRKIHVLYNGVAPLEKPEEAQREALRRSYGFDREDFVLGILARVETYKGHGVLLEAARLLLERGRRVKVLIAGDGDDLDHIRREAESLPPGTAVFTGFLTQVECALWAMDLQVNASTESEGTSLSLLEGMSLGLPAVVSDVGGNPMLIRDGENGLVVPRAGQRRPGGRRGRADGRSGADGGHEPPGGGDLPGAVHRRELRETYGGRISYRSERSTSWDKITVNSGCG